jgi:PAS domain S-box-containing protein
VNQAYETITGRSRRSLMENPLSYEEVIHPDDRSQVLAKRDEATRTGKFDERFRITLPNGQIRWVRVHGFPVRNAAGKIWRLVGTAQDITEQKLAEDQVVKRSGHGRSREGRLCRPVRNTADYLQPPECETLRMAKPDTPSHNDKLLLHSQLRSERRCP